MSKSKLKLRNGDSITATDRKKHFHDLKISFGLCQASVLIESDVIVNDGDLRDEIRKLSASLNRFLSENPKDKL